jgi:hypothetical protein
MTLPSSRTMAALAYERGEHYDPVLLLSDGLLEQLALGERATPPIEAPSEYERRRRRQRERRRALARVPDWFSLENLLDGPLPLVHGEPV